MEEWKSSGDGQTDPLIVIVWNTISVTCLVPRGVECFGSIMIVTSWVSVVTRQPAGRPDNLASIRGGTLTTPAVGRFQQPVQWLRVTLCG